MTGEAPVLPEPLLVATPAAWVDAAAERWQELLVDHANCEKKAASTALSLLFAYPEDEALSLALSRLAREELRHFEQVTRLMGELGVPFRRLSPSRYASGLRQGVRRDEPGRKVDLLLAGALIEARSCERFRLLATRLPTPVGALYAQLERSEARHGDLYLKLARREASAESIAERLGVLATLEAELAVSADEGFRFHSGPPTARAC